MRQSIDPSRFDEGRDEEICRCGHPRRHHLSSHGACFSPAGTVGLCPSLCRRFERDRAANRARREYAQWTKSQYDLIDRVAPFVDAGWSGEGWRPSQLMAIGYAVLATGRRPDSAAPWLADLIEEARRRYRGGFHADPFTSSPRRR